MKEFRLSLSRALSLFHFYGGEEIGWKKNLSVFQGKEEKHDRLIKYKSY